MKCNMNKWILNKNKMLNKALVTNSNKIMS